MQKHVKKESNMQTALQKVVMTLKINQYIFNKMRNEVTDIYENKKDIIKFCN